MDPLMDDYQSHSTRRVRRVALVALALFLLAAGGCYYVRATMPGAGGGFQAASRAF